MKITKVKMIVNNKQNIALFELPADKLLSKFGSGTHSPGSGSAAALMGILSCKLILTVCKLSLKKPKYKEAFKNLQFLIDSIEKDIEPWLAEYFELDAKIFDSVIEHRINRDTTKDDGEKKLHRREELKQLRKATEIPIEIGKLCLTLIDYGIYIFDDGFQSARGDSGAAVGSAIAAVTASAFVANLNLTSFGQSDWREGISAECQKLISDLNVKQNASFSRLTKLSKEEINSMELDFD
jgi:formiminotetrahydrofolate cyclodeaminase